MTTWDTILARETLADFPCPTHMHGYEMCETDCSYRVMCSVRVPYYEYLGLRAVVAALFVHADGSMRAPEHVLKGLRGWRDKAIEGTREWDYYEGLVKAMEQLEAIEAE